MMTKRLLLLLIVLCGVYNGNAWAGNFSVGAVWDATMKSPRPIWGIRGYIILEPSGMYQSGKGIIFHTHTNGSKYGSEVLVEYSEFRAWLKLYKWVPNNRNLKMLWDNNNSLTYPFSATGTAQTSNPIFIGTVTTGSVASTFSPYTEELLFGTETKRVMYFDNLSVFEPLSTGATTGLWREVTSIWNFQTGRMEIKWAFQWDGTLGENYSASSTDGAWAGAIETNDIATGTVWASGTHSAGNYLMDFIGPAGQWLPLDNVVCNTRFLDTGGTGGLGGGNTGLQTYYPASPSPGFHLSKVP